jgi:hypothetical protein
MKREPTRREQLRRAFHGPVLKDISDQVWVPHSDGRRYQYSKAAWKLFFADLFDAPLVEVTTPDGEIQLRPSTEGFDDEAYAQFIKKVEAHAATEWGVTFTEKRPPC